MEDTVEVVISVSSAALGLSRAGKEYLFENCRDKFFGRCKIKIREPEEPERLDSDRYVWNYDSTVLRDRAEKQNWYFNENGTLGNMPEDWQARADKDLVHAAKEFGGEDGLKVVEIPAGTDWYVDEYEGGYEVIREEHRTWN